MSAASDSDALSSRSNELKGKVALITGASSGIGAATAKLFSRLGAHLALNDCQEVNIQQIAQECEQENRVKPLTVVGDVTSEADAARIVESAIKHFSKLDILVNNAGIYMSDSIDNASLETFDRVMNTNVRSVHHMTLLAVPHLILTKGSIVNVSSMNGIRAFPGDLSYCMSKAAIDQFTRCVALDLAPKQVRCNSVNPGVIKTNIHKRAGMGDEEYDKFMERGKVTHPLGRVGEADEVAEVIAFLASDAASFITGVQMPVDGGRQVTCNLPADYSKFSHNN